MDSVSTLLEKNRNTKNETIDISQKSLNGIPEELKEFTWIKKLCIKKNTITSIPTSEFPPHITFIDISFNRIIKINGSMLTIKLVVLKAQSNRIQEFDGIQFKHLENIDLSFNELTEIKSFPPNIIRCDFSFNKIIEIKLFPANLVVCNLSSNSLQIMAPTNSKLKILDVSHNNIKDSDKITLNNGLKEFDISENKLEELPKVPDTLESLIFSHNNILEINEPLPKSLKKLCGENNRIMLFDTVIPINIHTIDLEGNRLSEFIDISNTNIVYMNLGNNCLLNWPDSERIPLSLKKLDISNNFVSSIPVQLKSRDNLMIIFNDDDGTNVDDDIFDLFHQEGPKDLICNNNCNSNFSPNWWDNNKQHVKTHHMTYDIPVTNTISL